MKSESHFIGTALEAQTRLLSLSGALRACGGNEEGKPSQVYLFTMAIHLLL